RPSRPRRKRPRPGPFPRKAEPLKFTRHRRSFSARITSKGDVRAQRVATAAEKNMFFKLKPGRKTFRLPSLQAYQQVWAEGFQRAIGKPFGRARRRETFCARKALWHNP